MSIRSPSQGKRTDDPILPLINIVFLLLIFFMLAGRFATTDPFVLEPLQSISEAADAPGLMILQVSKSGEVAIDGNIIASDDLDRAIQERLSTEPPNGVRIKADSASVASEVIELITRLGDAGIDDLRLMTVARQP